MSDETRRALPTWAVVLCALIGPIVIALGFFTAMDYANRPTPGPMQPGEGQQIADMNNAIVGIHAIAQAAFVLLGAVWLADEKRKRLLFLAITIPFCGLVFLISFIGVLAG